MIETLLNTSVAGQRLQGTLCLPQGGPAPCILMLHGFTGSRDEQVIAGVGEGVFSRTARRWAQRGMASFRIDFRGSSFLGGGSDGDFADTTYETQIADAHAAWAALESDARVTPLAVLGWSMGGLVAASFAGRSQKPRATALWAPLANPRASLAEIQGTEILRQRLAEPGPHRIDLPWGKTVHLKRGYFEGVMSHRPTEEIAHYPGPLFVAHGTKDDVIPLQAAEAFIAAHQGVHEAWITEMDHSFNASQGPEMLDRLADATLDFILKSTA